MLDALVPRDVRDVNQTVHAVLYLDESAEVGQVSDAAAHAVADVEAVGQRLPRIRLRLLHAEADATVLRVNAKHFDFDVLARLDEFRRMLHPLRPSHLRDV